MQHLELLIENKANVNAKNNKGEAALIMASNNGYYEVVKLLIENRAEKKKLHQMVI